jgi:hypothetical protein
MMLLLCTLHSPIRHHLHHQMLVLSQLTSTMLLTCRQVMHQAHLATKVSLLAIKVAIKATKLALVATCTVAQAMLIRKTLDIKVDQVTQVAASQATQAIRAQVHHLMRGGTGLGRNYQ